MPQGVASRQYTHMHPRTDIWKGSQGSRNLTYQMMEKRSRYPPNDTLNTNNGAVFKAGENGIPALQPVILVVMCMYCRDCNVIP